MTSKPNRQVQLPKETFYKRNLPLTCISFDSPEGKRLFRLALDEDNMESYFPLSMQYLTQSEPAFCGVSSLCMILNAIGIDPFRKWKGPWRWFDESMLDCCRQLEEIKLSGVTLPEFVCIAKCNRLKAQGYHADQIDKATFLNNLKETCRGSKHFMVVSFHRGTLGQTGVGHFSPVGGYCEKEDKVLIMDVARFKYPAYWVSADILWDSLHPLDTDTGKPRGYVLLSRGRNGYVQSALSQLSCNKDSWPVLSSLLFQSLPQKVDSLAPNTTIQDFLSLIISSIPDEYYSVVNHRLPLFVTHANESEEIECDKCTAACDEALDSTQILAHECTKRYLNGLDELLEQLSKTELYSLVSSTMETKRKLQKIIENDIVNSPGIASPNVPIRSRKSSVQTIEKLPRSNSLFKNHMLPDLIGSLQRLDSNSRQASSLSLVSITSGNVSDFVAFLTMFLYALFTYRPSLYENFSKCGSSKLVEQIRGIVALNDSTPHLLREEIMFLRDQMSALNELVPIENK